MGNPRLGRSLGRCKLFLGGPWANPRLYQWPCNRNRFIGGTYHIFWAYLLGLDFREYPNNSYGQKYDTNVAPSIGSWNSHCGDISKLPAFNHHPNGGLDITAKLWKKDLSKKCSKAFLRNTKMTRNTSTYLFRGWFDGITKDINWLVVWNMNFIVPYIGNVIIPTDFHIFQRGGSTTNQWSTEFLSINIDLPGFTHIKTMVFQLVYYHYDYISPENLNLSHGIGWSENWNRKTQPYICW